MKQFNLALTPQKISTQLGGELILKNEVELTNVAELPEADDKSVCFYENHKYLHDLKDSKSGFIFVPKDFDIDLKPDANLLLIDKPYIHFIMLVKTWLELCSPKSQGNISGTAIISGSAKLGRNITICNNVLISDNVIIGDNTKIYSNCVINENVKIGSNCRIHPNTTIYEDTVIKNNVSIFAGCVIGADGFGYLFHDGIQNKIPQVGNVIIEDNVEIGANTTIDRAAIGSTIIRNGTKIDNLVQIGHNCKIGRNSILCSQVGLAGSTEIGDIVYLAGQVGVAGHLKIDDEAMIGAQSGVSGSIPKRAKYFGTPAIDAGLKKRIIASEKKIPEIVKYYNKINKKQKSK
ncbi:MAG: UDP-3-O-(3-hydroxymyristoyl)glucosamine N-acyltransferase [Candidatus Cloacimonetes bacterium]|nr:UDP-3-O-(3-hydroxymyristoyl)glucosamine N-acyltransferase [Candidatus Cloacimonadota bacterium]